MWARTEKMSIFFRVRQREREGRLSAAARRRPGAAIRPCARGKGGRHFRPFHRLLTSHLHSIPAGFHHGVRRLPPPPPRGARRAEAGGPSGDRGGRRPAVRRGGEQGGAVVDAEAGGRHRCRRSPRRSPPALACRTRVEADVPCGVGVVVVAAHQRLPAHGLCELLIPDEHVADVVELVLLDGDELPAHGLGERGHGLPDLDVLGELLVHGRGGPDEEAAGAEDAVELEEEGAVSVSRAVPSSTRLRGDDTGGRRARARRRASGTRRWRPSGRWRCSRSPLSRRGRQRRRTGAARTGSGAPREAAGGAGAVTGVLPARVAALESLMLVQALECYFELAVAEGRASGAVLDGGPS
uniref:Uncharacterized protein n=1 Tax=Oryza rufipogon TaxID=4529 RepID=A0A0E0PM43_ORYRU